MKEISRVILQLAQTTNIKWCILRKEHEVLLGVENDIDIFSPRKTFDHFVALISKGFRDQNIKVIKTRFQTAGISFLVYSEQSNEFQKLDIVHDTTFLCLSIFPSPEIENNIKVGECYPVLEESVAQEISLRKEMVRNDLVRFFSRVRAQRGKYRAAGRKRLLILDYLNAAIANWRNPSGRIVVLVGPDGSGKTSIMHELSNDQKKYYFSVSKYHFNIQVLPRLATFRLKRQKEPDYTKPNSGSTAPIQNKVKATIYTLYYGIELLIYSHLILNRRKRLGQLSIFDRFFHDYFFQRSYRKAPRRLIKFFLKYAKQPDLIIFCDGEPGLINARKPELSTVEITTQQNHIKSVLVPFWLSIGVDVKTVNTTDKAIPEILQDINIQLNNF